jgi:iduronate 2-sulfatase
MDWRVPAGWLDLFPPSSETALAAHRTVQHLRPPVSIHCPFQSHEYEALWSGWGYTDPWTPMRNASAQEMRLFYRAAIAFMDSLVGTLLDELDLAGLADETAVIFHSDHGFMLGENGEWKKFTLTELGTRVPLIARVPWMPHTAGTRTSALVELIDVMPTLADLAGLPPPAVAPGDAPLDGTSMLPLFGVTPPTSLKTHVLSQYPRCPTNTTVPQLLWRTNLCINTPSSEFGWMGYSLRTDEWSASILLDAAGCNCLRSFPTSK